MHFHDFSYTFTFISEIAMLGKFHNHKYEFQGKKTIFSKSDAKKKIKLTVLA